MGSGRWSCWFGSASTPCSSSGNDTLPTEPDPSTSPPAEGEKTLINIVTTMSELSSWVCRRKEEQTQNDSTVGFSWRNSMYNLKADDKILRTQNKGKPKIPSGLANHNWVEHLAWIQILVSHWMGPTGAQANPHDIIKVIRINMPHSTSPFHCSMKLLQEVYHSQSNICALISQGIGPLTRWTSTLCLRLDLLQHVWSLK